MSSELNLPYKLNELNTLYPLIKGLFNKLDLNHLGRLSFIQSSNDLLNRVLSISAMPDFEINVDVMNIEFQEQLGLIQSIHDVHVHAQKVKGAFRKAALELALGDDLSDQTLIPLSSLTSTLCLLLQHISFYHKEPSLAGEAV